MKKGILEGLKVAAILVAALFLLDFLGLLN
jgi:hypothetical protein